MQDEPTQNPKKLFVGNLPFSMTEDGVTQLFAEYGEIAEIKLVLDRETQRSRGFAFVEYAEEESAQKAIEALHGQEIEGRELVVNVARPPRPRQDRRDFGGGGRRDFGGGGRRDSGAGRRDFNDRG